MTWTKAFWSSSMACQLCTGHFVVCTSGDIVMTMLAQAGSTCRRVAEQQTYVAIPRARSGCQAVLMWMAAGNT